MRCLIVFASCEGQTEKISQWLATYLRRNEIPTDLYNVTKQAADEVDLDTYDAVVIGSPIHYTSHDDRIRFFVRINRDRIRTIPSAFFSVSLGLASSHADDREDAERLADDFIKALGWKPSLKRCFAGAIRYSKYGWLKKRMMRWIANQSGEADTDFATEHEYTDWEQVRIFATEFAAIIHQQSQRDPEPHRSPRAAVSN